MMKIVKHHMTTSLKAGGIRNNMEMGHNNPKNQPSNSGWEESVEEASPSPSPEQPHLTENLADAEERNTLRATLRARLHPPRQTNFLDALGVEPDTAMPPK